MITYQVERLEDCLEELKPILKAHWEEVALNKDKIKLNPDYERYLALDKAGALHTVIARDNDKLIGYYISFISYHIHYADNIYAMNDVIYIDPSYRKGTVAYRLLKFAEMKLKELGVDVMMLHMKTEHPFDRLCEGVGMKKVESIYSKYIGD